MGLFGAALVIVVSLYLFNRKGENYKEGFIHMASTNWIHHDGSNDCPLDNSKPEWVVVRFKTGDIALYHQLIGWSIVDKYFTFTLPEE